MDALFEIHQISKTLPKTSIIVICADPGRGQGGVVHIPAGSSPRITLLGQLASAFLDDEDSPAYDRLFDSITTLLYAPQPGEA